MSNAATIRVLRTTWNASFQQLASIRRAVFVEEQHVPAELEWDGLDPHCDHMLALSPLGEPIGTGRLLPDGHIGRMAVMVDWRRRGVGTQLLLALIELARARGHEKVVLNAQTHAVDFYRRAGFRAFGDVFLDAGIPHVTMSRSLSAGSDRCSIS